MNRRRNPAAVLPLEVEHQRDVYRQPCGGTLRPALTVPGDAVPVYRCDRCGQAGYLAGKAAAS